MLQLKVSNRLIKFIVVGCINTAVDYIVYSLVLLSLGFSGSAGLVAVAKTAGFSVAVVNSYFFNRSWTFVPAVGEKHALDQRTQFFRFYVSSLLGLLVNVSSTITALYVLSHAAWFNNSFSADMAFLIGTFFTMLWNFIIYKYFVFHS